MIASTLLARLIAAALLSVSVSAQIKPLSYTTPTYIDLEASEYEVTEGMTNIAIAVFRTGEFRVSTSIDYRTVEIDASEGQDYSGAGGTLVFQPGEGYKTISIPIHADDSPEGAEAFRIELTCENPKVVFFRQSATISIIDPAQSLAATPRLEIRAGEPGTILLQWKDSTARYALEKAPSAQPTQWAAVATSPVVHDGKQTVQEPIDGNLFFYRLKAQE